jgi:hypothetical protein
VCKRIRRDLLFITNEISHLVLEIQNLVTSSSSVPVCDDEVHLHIENKQRRVLFANRITAGLKRMSSGPREEDRMDDHITRGAICARRYGCAFGAFVPARHWR